MGGRWTAFLPLLSSIANPPSPTVKIIYSSICGSDVSGLAGHFGPVQPDRVAGHEIAGEVVRVGKEVKGLKVGDKVGIGAQCDACGECRWCGDRE